MKARRKPIELEFIVWTGDNLGSVELFCGQAFIEHSPVLGLRVRTLEGWVAANPGDYIMKGTLKEFWPVKPDIFALSYEIVED